MESQSHWLNENIEKILATKKPPIILNAGKTTSGTIHIGILRELLINDGLYRILTKKGITTKFLLFMDDFDSAKHFPNYIPSSFSKYQGFPFCDIPDPYGCHASYAQHFAEEFIETLDQFYLYPEIIYTSKAYQSKKMKNAVRIALNKVEAIRKIYLQYILPTLNPSQQTTYPQKLKTWFPAMVVCPKCGHLAADTPDGLQTNRVIAYNPIKDIIQYRCHHCSTDLSSTIDQARVKLTWRVDWPAKWSVYQIDVEPAGKDHAVKGGAYDTGLEISKQIFDYPGPVKIAYEWLRFGDRDMKTHKGIVFTPKEYINLGYPEALRQLILQSSPPKSISFRPEFFPQMVDSFIQMEADYYSTKDDGREEKTVEINKFLYPLCIPTNPRKNPPKRLPYRFAILVSQLEPILTSDQILTKSEATFQKFNNTKTLSKEDRNEILNTIKKAKHWVDNYAPLREKISIPKKIPREIIAKLDVNQKLFLLDLAAFLEAAKEYEDGDILQNNVFNLGTTKNKLSAKKTFQAVYYALISKPFGPRLAPFIQILDKPWMISRLREAGNG